MIHRLDHLQHAIESKQLDRVIEEKESLSTSHADLAPWDTTPVIPAVHNLHPLNLKEL